MLVSVVLQEFDYGWQVFLTFLSEDFDGFCCSLRGLSVGGLAGSF